jgi:hypothetical protein
VIAEQGNDPAFLLTGPMRGSRVIALIPYEKSHDEKN